MSWCPVCHHDHDTSACHPLPVTQVRAVPYRCPVCNGMGKISTPPWVAGNQPSWTSSTVELYDCPACERGIVWRAER